MKQIHSRFSRYKMFFGELPSTSSSDVIFNATFDLRYLFIFSIHSPIRTPLELNILNL